MIIELDELFCHNTNEIMIDDKITFNDEKYSNNEIKELKDITFKGKICYDIDESIKLVGNIYGTMIIEDAISLDDIEYHFTCEIDENLDEFIENNQNTIDIIEILWQNIVLEIPLKYTLVDDLSKYQGDGWKLIREDEIKRDNPFSILAENMKEE